ncbi:MAG: PLP-dependent aminotransferase family protein [Ruminococcus sp.]|nr:PLP-dependent aminotransferase family protein [Ruminococcus sp.]
MLSDFISINRKDNTPVYIQIYREIKKAIESGSISGDEKLPSVRKICADLGVSKTTVETAYNALCAEGYIINKPQRGYYVEKGIVIENKTIEQKTEKKKIEKIYKYDFSGKGIDKNISNIKEWRKYVKDILNKDYLLNTYSENQGEPELRKAISKYAFSSRGAESVADNIVIGSGSQTLIYILCGLLGLDKTVAMERNSFPQAEQVFSDFKYDVRYTDSDSKGITVSSLEEIKPDIILINPNYSKNGLTGMPVTRKLEIINYAEEHGTIILEDDYNGELRYKSHPTACLQSLGTDCTVYIGSFSRILLPSVRISFMCLPENLIKKYSVIKENYNQTTSKTEQLALAEYIKDGKLEKQLRKLRRYYNIKSDLMKKCIKQHFSDYDFNETSMYFEIKGDSRKLINSDIKAMRTSDSNAIRLNFSQINNELIENGIKEVKDLIK